MTASKENGHPGLRFLNLASLEYSQKLNKYSYFANNLLIRDVTQAVTGASLDLRMRK
jgi:hypothetical protein